MTIWQDHPLFDVETPSEALQRLDGFDEGIIALGVEGNVLSANAEAKRILSLDAAVELKDLDTIGQALGGWQKVVDAVEVGKQTDVALQGARHKQYLATLRKMPGQAQIGIILIRDLDALEFRKSYATGGAPKSNVHFLTFERTRPDFEQQRRLSPELNRVLSRGERALRQGARVLITGESGVGKGEIARALHRSVSDAQDPFVVVNCASASGDRLERQLFGAAASDRTAEPSLVEQAQGGTLFLDEVADIPMSLQARLLGFLEDSAAATRLGNFDRRNQVRVVAATNKDLKQLVREGEFRADLFFRLAVINLQVPPLRDMQPLVLHLIERFTRTLNRRREAPIEIPHRLQHVLMDYSFPGNIRELLNIVQRIAVLQEDSEEIEELIYELISPIDVPDSEAITGPSSDTYDLRAEVRRYERILIDRAIRTHGSKRKAAKALGVDIGTIVRKTAEPTVEVSSGETPNKEITDDTHQTTGGKR